MKQHEFDNVVRIRREAQEALLRGKGLEYVPDPDADALGNFKAAAADAGVEPLQAWLIFFNKHVQAIKTYVRTGQEGAEPIEGRIDDAMNYLMLGAALIHERKTGNSAEVINA